jgi:hypothetical protein
MGDSTEVVQEKIKSLEESVRDLRDSVRGIEARAWRLEGRAESFESAHDDNKEKWNMALNFVVQLLWVATASFVLAKLGLSTGPI